MKKRINRLIVLTICLACLLSSMGTAAMAAGPIDLGADVSLSVSFIVDGKAIPNVAIAAYRVADVDEWGDFTLCGDFRSYNGAINDWTTAEEWDNAAGRLADFASRKRLVAPFKSKTDDFGCVTFSRGLETGLYLVVFSTASYNGRDYTAKPFLVSVPGFDEYYDEWVYNVTVSAKAGVVPTPPPSAPPYLPQTGQLWWPVPALLCGGLFLLLVGVVKRRSRNDEET